MRPRAEIEKQEVVVKESRTKSNSNNIRKLRTHVSTVARSCAFGSAVQNKLNTEVDVIALGVACDLNAISKRRQGSMSPATSTVLRNVLVKRFRQVTLAVDVTPVKGIGELVGTDVGVGKSRNVVVMNGIFADVDFAEVFGGGDCEDRGKGESNVKFHDEDVVLDIYSDIFIRDKNYDTSVFFLFVRRKQSIIDCDRRGPVEFRNSAEEFTTFTCSYPKSFFFVRLKRENYAVQILTNFSVRSFSAKRRRPFL